MDNVVYIISGVSKSAVFERTALELSKSTNLTVILLNNSDSYFEDYLKEHKIRVKRFKQTSKVFSIFTLISLCSYLRKIKPDILHCHLLYATLMGFAAAKIVGIKKRIYTRHHSNFHFEYAPHAVKYDRWINKNAYKIIAVSLMVKDFLIRKENVPADKILVVNHGINISEFDTMDAVKVAEMKRKYDLVDSLVIGSVARYDRWKGVQYTITAFQQLLKTKPNLKLVLANAGKGDNVTEVNAMLGELPLGSYVQIPFENEMSTLYKCMDLCIHVPIDDESEAFGQVYIEAMAASVPLVATRSGIGNEILDHLKNAYIVNYKNSKDIVAGVEFLLTDEASKRKMIVNAFELVKKNFDMKDRLEEIKNIYAQL